MHKATTEFQTVMEVCHSLTCRGSMIAVLIITLCLGVALARCCWTGRATRQGQGYELASTLDDVKDDDDEADLKGVEMSNGKNFSTYSDNPDSRNGTVKADTGQSATKDASKMNGIPAEAEFDGDFI